MSRQRHSQPTLELHPQAEALLRDVEGSPSQGFCSEEPSLLSVCGHLVDSVDTEPVEGLHQHLHQATPGDV